MKATRRAMVIGGAGFVGSSLVARLLGRGYDVDVVDNLSTGSPENLMEFLDWRGFRFLRGDISDPDVFDLLTYRPRVDEIYHLACPVHVSDDTPLDTEMLDACFVATEHVLELARLWESVVVYARPALESQRDQVFCEKLVASETEKLGVDSRIVRISDVYGPRMSLEDSRVIPRFLAAALRSEPATIYGDGTHTRQFLYVDDLLNGLQAIVDDGLPGEVFELAGEAEVSIRGLHQAIGTLVGTVPPIHEPHEVVLQRRRPDTTSVRELGWEAEVSVLDGLAMCLASPRLRAAALGEDIEEAPRQWTFRPDVRAASYRRSGQARAL